MIEFGRRSYSVFVFFILIFLLFVCGSITLYSATCYSIQKLSPYFIKQICGFICGICIFYLFSNIFYKKIIIWGMLFHFFVIALLLFTLIKGSFVMGGKRWINLYIIKFQPSELAKISLPLSLVHYLYYFVEKRITTRDWIILFGLIFFTGFLIMRQPDLGTALVVMISSLILLFVAGLPKKIIYCSLFFLMISGPLLWKKLHNYQKRRILVFLGYGSVYKERYQLEQSKIAIGSGGICGKGYLNGTQKNFQFLPENRTDFIFSVLAEEFGFIGVSIIFLLYTLLFILFYIQSIKITDFYGYILYVALLFPFILGVIFNMGMVVGLFPVVGIPLPGMSYGLTHIISTSILFGLAASIIRFRE